MEVHAHSHSHGKKNWKSYFWEFLMLFLAVFCGFMAEYQLEHKIEKDRERQYIQSMVDDIKEDAVKIKKSIDDCNGQLSGFDSLLQNIHHTPYTDSSIRMMYYLQRRYTSTRYTVLFTKRTITQLKNSGGLRLIKNKAASDSIIIYDEGCEKAETQGDYFVYSRLDKVNDRALKIFNSLYILNYGRDNASELLNSNTKVSLLGSDRNLLLEYANTIYYSRGTLANYINMLIDLQKRIPGILSFLESKYHLK